MAHLKQSVANGDVTVQFPGTDVNARDTNEIFDQSHTWSPITVRDSEANTHCYRVGE